MELNIEKKIWNDWLNDNKYHDIIQSNIVNKYPVLEEIGKNAVDLFLNSLSLHQKCHFFKLFSNKINKSYDIYHFYGKSDDLHNVEDLFKKWIAKNLPEGNIVFPITEDAYYSVNLYYSIVDIHRGFSKKIELIKKSLELIKMIHHRSYLPYYSYISSLDIQQCIDYIEEKGDDFTAALVATDNDSIAKIQKWARSINLKLNHPQVPYIKIKTPYGDFYPEDFDYIQNIYDKYHQYFKVYPKIKFFDNPNYIKNLELKIKNGEADNLLNLYDTALDVISTIAKTQNLHNVNKMDFKDVGDDRYQPRYEYTVESCFFIQAFMLNIFNKEKNIATLQNYHDLFLNLQQDCQVLSLIDASVLSPKLEALVKILSSPYMFDVLTKLLKKDVHFNIEKMLQKIQYTESHAMAEQEMTECDLFI